MTQVRLDLKTLGGGLSPVESTSDSLESGGMAPRRDWQTSRIGADFPQPVVLAEQQAFREGGCRVRNES